MGDNLTSRGNSVNAQEIEDAAVTIRRLRQRLYVVEPVYRAALALHRKGVAETRAAIEDVERAVDRAIETERRLAEGWSISNLDLAGDSCGRAMGAPVGVAHTCDGTGRLSCEPCLHLESELWDAINCYAISVGGDPSRHGYGNVPRMQAVVDVRAAIDERASSLAAASAKTGVLRGALPAAGSLPTNPDCTGTVGKDFITCGEEGYYCSDRCWTIGSLGTARALVSKYEQQLGISVARDPG